MSINPFKTEGATELLLAIAVFILVVILSIVMIFSQQHEHPDRNKIQINGEDYILRSYIQSGVMYVDTLKQ